MITVIIPVKNRAELVKRTLKSLDEQTQRPAAVILVDNNSTDRTLSVLRQWADAKPWVTVISETKPGAAAARNAGMASVQTPYVLFFDSDDVMPSGHIEQITRELIDAGRPKIAVFDMELIGLDGKTYEKKFRKGDPMRMQIFHSILSTQRCVVASELVRAVGGWNEKLLVWDDWEFGIRLLAAESNVTYIKLDEPVRVYAQAESITGVDFSSKRDRWEQALDAAEDVLSENQYRRLIDYRRAILAGMYRREGHPEYVKGLTKGLRMKFIERYVAAGGRGVEQIAKILR